MSSISFLGLWGLFQLCGVHRWAGAWAADLSLVLEYVCTYTLYETSLSSRYLGTYS